VTRLEDAEVARIAASEQALLDREILRSRFDDAPVGYVTTTLDATIVDVNDTFLRWLSLHRHDVVTLRRLPDLMTSGSRLVYLTRHVVDLERDSTLGTVALDFSGADGTVFSTLLTAVITPSPSGERVIAFTILDAGERREFERALTAARHEAEESARYLALLHGVASACAHYVTAESVAQAVVEAALVGLSGLAGGLWVPDVDAGVMVRLAAVGEVNDLRPASLSIDLDDPVARAWRSETTQHVVRAEGVDPAIDAVMQETGVDSALFIPLMFEHSVLGVLSLYLRRAVPLTEAEVALIETLGHQVGGALERARLMGDLTQRATHDALTGLPNRVLLSDRLDLAVARTARAKQGSCLIALDLNGFKEVNDRLGHAAGDEVLREVARRLRTAVRPTDTVARMGGDEFIVLCEDIGPINCGALAMRIDDAIDITMPGEHIIRVTASVGFIYFDKSHDFLRPDQLLEEADNAMYRVKKAGRPA